MKKETWENRFDKRFPNEESGYQNIKGEYVHLFNPAVDVRNIRHFIKKEIDKAREEGFINGSELTGRLAEEEMGCRLADIYYKLEAKEGDLRMALEETRKEPVFGLQSIANVIKKALDKAEIEALVRHLKEELHF